MSINSRDSNLKDFAIIKVTQVMANPSESSRLLVNTASEEDSSPLQPQKRAGISCPPSKHLCLPSKAAILILLWTAIVGAMYYVFMGLAVALEIFRSKSGINFSVYDSLLYAILALVMMFYPLSGFFADVCCGRLKIVIISLVILLVCLIILLIGIVLGDTITALSYLDQIHNQGVLITVVLFAFLILFSFIIGLAGYQANFIQLGLDQLFEAPNQYLGLFIHYATWAFQSGALSFIPVFYLLLCSRIDVLNKILGLSFIIMYVLSIAVLLLISCVKQQWFHIEPGYQNPYKIVYGILRFAKSHKHPLRRSAFTFSENYIPSRLDFAKQRFGGPFTTEQVEDIKTFIRILLVLFAVGPAFALEVPVTYFIAPLFGIHFIHHETWRKYCSSKFLLAETIGLLLVPSTLLFPLCSLIVFSFLRKKLLKLFTRLGVGIFICLLGVLCLLLTDVVGHIENISKSSNHSRCVFQVIISHRKNLVVDSLDMHWSVLIPPSLLLGLGPLMVIATTLEFISAQSPQSMKGLLVGVFFAIRGLFQFLNTIVIIPLSLKQPWASREMIEHPPVTNCGFVYLALTSVTGLIGLILFTLAAKRYKYRTRDEGMFRQHDVEEIYDRYMDQRESEDYSYDSVED